MITRHGVQELRSRRSWRSESEAAAVTGRAQRSRGKPPQRATKNYGSEMKLSSAEENLQF